MGVSFQSLGVSKFIINFRIARSADMKFQGCVYMLRKESDDDMTYVHQWVFERELQKDQSRKNRKVSRETVQSAIWRIS